MRPATANAVQRIIVVRLLFDITLVYWLRLVCATHILRLVGRIFGRNTELVGGAKRPIRITKRRTSDFDGVGGTGFQNLLGLLRLVINPTAVVGISARERTCSANGT